MSNAQNSSFTLEVPPWGSYNQHLELSGASLRSYVPFRPTLFNNDQMQLRGRWPLNHLVCPAQYHDGYWYSHSVPSPSTYLKTMGFKWPNKGWKQETFWKRICQMLHQNLIKCYLTKWESNAWTYDVCCICPSHHLGLLNQMPFKII